MSKGGGSVKTPNPDEYAGLIQAQDDANRIDQHTPYGSITYKKKKPMSYKQWSRENPADKSNQQTQSVNQRGETVWGADNTSWKSDHKADYREYKNSMPKKAKFNYSPELQTLFDTQFDPNSYDNYADEYMGRYNELIAPNREDQLDQFQQSMFNRGLPDTSEVYGDVYRNTVGDPNARMDLMAQQQSQDIAYQRSVQDFNKLMAAMGGSQIAVPNVDTMGPANMVMNANMANAQTSNQQNSDMWNSMALMGAAAICSKEFKEEKEPIDTLDNLLTIPVEEWRYKPMFNDTARHVSPYAEDFQKAFGLGDGTTIPLIDMIGVTMRAVQELAQEVRELKKCQQ